MLYTVITMVGRTSGVEFSIEWYLFAFVLVEVQQQSVSFLSSSKQIDQVKIQSTQLEKEFATLKANYEAQEKTLENTRKEVCSIC